MKLAFLTLVIAVPALAGVLSPVDTSRSADVNGRIVEMPAANLKSLSLPVLRQGNAPATGRRFETRTVEQRRLDLESLSLRTVETDTRPMPKTNFSSRRASGTDRQVETSRRETGAAPINRTEIRATTPAGEQELKSRLNRVP